MRVHDKRKRKLAYQQACSRQLERLFARSKIDLGIQPNKSAHKVEFLFLDLLPDQKYRLRKLRSIFMGRFHWGDDIYIRIMYDYLRKADLKAAKITRAYKEEHDTMIKAKNENKPHK